MSNKTPKLLFSDGANGEISAADAVANSMRFTQPPADLVQDKVSIESERLSITLSTSGSLVLGSSVLPDASYTMQIQSLQTFGKDGTLQWSTNSDAGDSLLDSTWSNVSGSDLNFANLLNPLYGYSTADLTF
eukprot:CAMPEP_0116900124 /NCGR_PEP_ID=MMETSP0467-20121206/8517_1 /TAXON_ID=283647 /ORGANISM="Mesodinium pulex, Strain SPMC105" /LENGTH=131 /DNA_ID=CAMNT_0004573279 /DNA_START=2991 /DNA_END=3386 /DNA_ORIENTATION=+